jgi:hypothetical protein
VGYTFDDTDLVIGDFVAAASVPFIYGAKAGSTLTSGPEGSLILTIVYDIDEKVITVLDLKPEHLTRIARPLIGKSVRVGTPYATSTDFVVTDDSPYTAKVAWSANSAPQVTGKFDALAATAKVTLTAKAGYKFNTTLTAAWSINGVASVVAVNPPATGGYVTVISGYEVEAPIVYTAGSAKQQITSLDGLSWDDIDPIPGQTAATATTQITSGVPIANAGTVAWLSGLNSGDFQFNTPATAVITLSPETGYTFYADDGPLPYLTYSDGTTLTASEQAIKDLIEGYFSRVYNGTSVPVANRVKSIAPPKFDNSGNLVLTLTFPPKGVLNDENNFTYAEIGDLPAAPTAGTAIPARLNNIGSTRFDVSDITWTSGGNTVNAGSVYGTAGTVYTAVITVTPKTGYTFVGADSNQIKSALANTAVWGTSSGHVLALAAGNISVKGVVVPLGTIEILSADDKIVITLTITSV